MKFGAVPTGQAAGLILAHSVLAGTKRLKKGCVLSDADIAVLAEAGVSEVTVAILGADDLQEDSAARQVGQSLLGANMSMTEPVAGRVNLVAGVDGVLLLRPEIIIAVNSLDEAITLAVLPNFARVRRGMLLATVKIIPYGVARHSVEAAVAAAGADAITVAPFQSKTYDLILTRTPGLKDSLLDKGRKAVQTRAATLGWVMRSCATVDHNRQAVAAALTDCRADIVLIFGASATSDRRDVIPAGLIEAGGEVIRFGMPVDPGNLLVLGRNAGQMVVGLPGCARAPTLNGADWVLERLAADLPLTNDDFAKMGLGGLLKEIPDRIQPRALRKSGNDLVPAVLLAAGASSRMGGENKLLRQIEGVPLLRRSAETLLAANIGECVVVISPDAPAHRQALEGLNVTIVEAADAGLGMSASLRAGVGAVPDDAKAVLVALADMPDMTPDAINHVIKAHDAGKGRLIICPVDDNGKRGHPVLFDRRFFENLQEQSGDRGARDVLHAVPEVVYEVRMDAIVTRDLDTPQDWRDWEEANSEG